MRLVLYPIGGLANRMRAIDSACNLKSAETRLSVWWVKDNGLNCDFSSLFELVSIIKDKELSKIYQRLFMLYDKKNKVIVVLLRLLEFFHILLFLDEYTCLEKRKLDKVNQYKFCFIRTWEAFYPKEKFHFELFKLRDKERLEQELLKINSNTIGVHIRRTDNVWAIKNSPLELFEQKMKYELEQNSDVDFYVCTDDKEVKQFFQTDFWKGKVKMPNGSITRNSEDGIVQAAVEMFALSKTNKIIGSYWSSFGEIAARLGNIEIEICTTTQS